MLHENLCRRSEIFVPKQHLIERDRSINQARRYGSRGTLDLRRIFYDH